jgi:transposase
MPAFRYLAVGWSSPNGGMQMTNTIILGIDVSKYFADMCAISGTGEVLLESKIYFDLAGLQHLTEQLRVLSKSKIDAVSAVMESTAHYHRILEQHLRRIGVDVTVINPIQSGSLKNLEIRKIKSDRTDAKRLAQMYLFKMFRQNYSDSGTIAALKDLTRQRNDIISERVRFSNKLTSLLDQVFPGFRKVFCSIQTHSATAVLSKYPTPEDVLSAKRSVICKVIAEASGKKPTSKYALQKAELLISVAKEAREIRVERSSFATLVSLYADMLINIRNITDTLEMQIVNIAQSDSRFWESVELLTTIPGVGQYAAIVLLSEIGDFTRFQKAKQLVAFAGLDPAVKQSGTMSVTHNKISKRGSANIRKILDMCTHVAVHPGCNHQPANAILAEFYEKKRIGKPANVALCACMHKMMVYIFAVLRSRKPFELRSPEDHMEIMRNNIPKMTA